MGNDLERPAPPAETPTAEDTAALTAYNDARTENSNRVVLVTGVNATLNGLTITKGQAGALNTGGGLLSASRNTSLTECTFTENEANNGGGAYFVHGSTLTGCTFTNNTARNQGGGVFFNSTATLTGCIFTNNTATTSHGGGAYFRAGATLTGCTFTGNKKRLTTFGGGAYFLARSTLIGCTFMGNSGGAHFVQGGTLTDCDFTGNKTSSGGGIYFFPGTGTATATLTRCTFTDNTVIDNGGGALILIRSKLTDCTFTDNETTSDTGGGGGAYFSNVVTLNGCTFTRNTSALGGGAYFSNVVTLTNGVFANNTATENGGGMFLASGGTITNSTIYSNTANSSGGGIYAEYTDGGDFNLQNSILMRNLASVADFGNQAFIKNADTINDRVSLQHNLFGSSLVYARFDAMTTRTETNTVTEADTAVVFASTTSTEENFLRLKEGSPAVNAGNNDYVNNAITTDLAGAVRIQGRTVDLGAYESDIKGMQTIDFTLDSTGVAGTELALTATASSGLSVSYASSNPAAAVVDTMGGSATLRLIAEGTATITASQSGNEDYLAAPNVTQTIVVIPPVIRRVTTAGDSTTDGSTWEKAMTLKAALAASDSLDQVWIASGTYQPDSANRTATFTIPAGVRVYGGFAGDESDSFDPMTTTRTGAATILSGDLLGDDTVRTAANYDDTRDDNSTTVVTIGGADVTLDGLTIQGGHRQGFRQQLVSCIFGIASG